MRDSSKLRSLCWNVTLGAIDRNACQRAFDGAGAHGQERIAADKIRPIESHQTSHRKLGRERFARELVVEMQETRFDSQRVGGLPTAFQNFTGSRGFDDSLPDDHGVVGMHQNFVPQLARISQSSDPGVDARDRAA